MTYFESRHNQASGETYAVNMGSAQTFNEIEMASPEVTQDYAGPYEVQVSSNGSSWTTVATCQGINTRDPSQNCTTWSSRSK